MRRSVAGIFVGIVFGVASTLSGADASTLFPEPLHLVREITTDAHEEPATIDEYCSGDRIVRVAGSRVTITDFAKREVRELDRGAGTFSSASFDELARARAEVARAFPSPEPATDAVETTRVGNDRVRIRTGTMSIELRLDDAITLSRDAFDALHGASHPDVPRPGHRLIANASRRDRNGRFDPVADAATGGHRLPLEQTIEVESAGERIRIASKVVRIIREPIPAGLLLLPAGSRQVDPHIVRFAREMQSLDRVTVPLQ